MLRNLIQAALKTRKRSQRRGRGRSSAGGSRANRLLFESLEPRVLLEGYTALQRPTELQYWDTAKADNGYNFYGVGGTSYLLDMEGKVVHTWPIGNNPHLLSNGGILDATTNDPSGFGGFREVSWEGTTVWSYTETRSTYHPHGDFKRIYNTKLGAYTGSFKQSNSSAGSYGLYCTQTVCQGKGHSSCRSDRISSCNSESGCWLSPSDRSN